MRPLRSVTRLRELCSTPKERIWVNYNGRSIDSSVSIGSLRRLHPAACRRPSLERSAAKPIATCCLGVLRDVLWSVMEHLDSVCTRTPQPVLPPEPSQSHVHLDRLSDAPRRETVRV